MAKTLFYKSNCGISQKSLLPRKSEKMPSLLCHKLDRIKCVTTRLTKTLIKLLLYCTSLWSNLNSVSITNPYLKREYVLPF
jgi:hypothetical protein